MERVVITGMGAVTPIGNDVATFWEGLTTGRNGIGPITQFDTTNFKAKLAAEVKDFDPTLYMDKRESKRMDRYCHFAIAAAKQAFEQSGLTQDHFDPYRAGVFFGSGVGGLKVFEDEFPKMTEKGPSRVSPLCIPEMIANMGAAHISMALGFKGESLCPVTACATGNHAIGEAYRTIKHGYQDIMIAGGAEASIIRIATAGFQNMKALHTGEDPNAASVPFDARRSGFVMGEGAGALILESLSHAKARGAVILGEIAGYGATSDAYHITAPDPDGEGGARAMLLAMADAGIEPNQVDYINAHGTSTPINEKIETMAIKKALGDAAYKVHISSTKSMTGHLLGAASAIEAIACVLAINHGIIPPTINYHEPDPDCDLDITPNQAVQTSIQIAMSNSLGFGGHNATVLFRKMEG